MAPRATDCSRMLAAAATTLLVAAASLRAQTDAPRTSSKEFMREAVKSFERMEKAIAAGNAGDAEAEAKKYGDAAARVDFSGSVRERPKAQMLERTLAESASKAELIARFANRKQLVEAGRAVEELRKACVACHVLARPATEQMLAPGKSGALAGTVQIETADGQRREDVSSVVVFLDGGPKDAAVLLPLERPKVSQKNQKFLPRVLPIVRGATVDFPNDDCIYHNAFSLSPTKTFDLGSYDPGTSKSVTFDTAGLVRVFCNLHPEMVSSVLVLANPHFTLTDANGQFALPEVPDGRWVLRVWNELGGECRQEIEIESAHVDRFQLKIKETQASLKHSNKFGKPYRQKY